MTPTPKQSAEDVAGEIIALSQCHGHSKHPNAIQIDKDLHEKVIHILTQYAEEKVKEWENTHHPKCLYAARDSALEEAARVVIDYKISGKFEAGHGFMTDLDEITIRVRSLKGAPKA